MDTEKMRACSPLLPAPGGEVVRECLDEIERLRQTCRNVYEVWAGSEGIPQPETAPEAYLLQLVERMRDEAKNGLHNAGVTGA